MATPKKWQNPDGTPKECLEPGCSNDVKVRGLCGSHYYRLRRGGDGPIIVGWYDAGGNRLPCTQLGCDEPVEARGLCRFHYRRNLRGGQRGMTGDSRRKWFNPDGSRMSCLEDGCNQPIRASGKCSLHYDRAWKEEMGMVKSADSFCPVDGCGRKKLVSAVLCGRCRQARWRYGLSDDRYIEMMRPQNRHCENPGCDNVENLHLDHDHSCCPPKKFEAKDRVACGECVRGWLCRSCNVTLGQMEEDPRRIEGLLTYLKNRKVVTS